MDFQIRCCLPRQFFPAKKRYVAGSVADSVVAGDGIMKFHRQVPSNESKSDSRFLSPILERELDGPDVACLSLVANFLLVTRYDLI